MKNLILFFLLIAVSFVSQSQTVFRPGPYAKGAEVFDVFGNVWKTKVTVKNALSAPKAGATWELVRPAINQATQFVILQEAVNNLSIRIVNLEIENAALKKTINGPYTLSFKTAGNLITGNGSDEAPVTFQIEALITKLKERGYLK